MARASTNTNSPATDDAAWRLPAEWEPQDGVLLAWPPATAAHWQPMLAAIRETIAALAAAISRFERVLLLTETPAATRAPLERAQAVLERVTLAAIPHDDVWARDFGPLTLTRCDNGARELRYLDFTFNGWGGKAPRYARDNAVTAALLAAGHLAGAPRAPSPLVLEGGSVDGDGQGSLLTTASCLLHPNRNPPLNRAAIEAALRQNLGARRVLWLEHGWLAGDDTDGHVDMLARFAPDNTIVYTACDDPRDEHAAALRAMEEELRALRAPHGQPYRLLPLPWPRALHDAAGHRLPASYANFLVINDAVIVPAYGDARDAEARATIGAAFPGRAIVALDATTPIRQHGSLHCLSMQLPRGALP